MPATLLRILVGGAIYAVHNTTYAVGVWGGRVPAGRRPRMIFLAGLRPSTPIGRTA
jgi:hypothetical protein